MPLDIVIGAQWGDEGKGKVVDCLNARHNYAVVVRFQGGANAGHTLMVNGQKFVLHLIPSGILNPQTLNVIGAGLVVDPRALRDEVNMLAAAGVDVAGRLMMSPLAHWILPTHQYLDRALEEARTGRHIGSTLRGIGPAYQDKVARLGLRVGDLMHPDFKQRYGRLRDYHHSLLEILGFEEGPSSREEQQWWEAVEQVRTLIGRNVQERIWRALEEGEDVLAEGAQGALLDVSFGTYPYVTSSHTIAPSAYVGGGVGSQYTRSVIGITKAYTTRVGEGPFPTELTNPMGEALRRRGGEFGATTSRPRRIGWLDLVALRYAVKVSGCTELIMTKVDVLAGREKVKAARRYVRNGQPYSFESFLIDPVLDQVEYQELAGWRSVSPDTPELQAYLQYVESQVGVPIRMVSTGPEREEFWIRN